LEAADDPARPTDHARPAETRLSAYQRLRRRVYRWLEVGPAGDAQGRWVDRLLIALVISAVLLVALETEPDFEEQWGDLFAFAELCIGTVFLVEYLARLWIADLHPPFRRYTPLGARLRYALQPVALIDLLAVLPFLLAPLLSAGDFKVLIFLRLARFFKIARYSPALRSLANAVFAERHAIGASLIIIFGVVMVAATAMYMAERHVQPDSLGTIPAAIWWALTTVTTVGYGDVVPVTRIGQMIGGLVMLLGYGLFALPVGIVATAFAREIHSRDFAITWGMVARVPLFQDLKAAEIAEITKLLRAQSAAPGQVISRRGEPANSMYFIASGAVEAVFETSRMRLEEGAFFGEMALLAERRRTATVSAVSPTQLLVLDSHDLRGLMRRKPAVARHVLDEVMRRRDASGGDMLEEEIVAAQADTVDRRRAGDAGDGEEPATEAAMPEVEETMPDLFAQDPQPDLSGEDDGAQDAQARDEETPDDDLPDDTVPGDRTRPA
jgi:voltage-gated potassium channel